MIETILLTSLVIYVEDPELRKPTVKAAQYWIDKRVIKSWCIVDDEKKANVRIRYAPPKCFLPGSLGTEIGGSIIINSGYKLRPYVLPHELGHAIGFDENHPYIRRLR